MTRPRLRHERKAWAVVVRMGLNAAKKEPVMCGRYWFDPKSKQVCPTALFETRREAREAASGTRGWYVPYARPVRVRVVVEEIE